VLSLCTHSLRDGQPMPPSVPLLERLATHGLHRTQHVPRHATSGQVIRDALTLQGGKIPLNWTMLQVRLGTDMSHA
jgi:hypothetical protein